MTHTIVQYILEMYCNDVIYAQCRLLTILKKGKLGFEAVQDR